MFHKNFSQIDKNTQYSWMQSEPEDRAPLPRLWPAKGNPACELQRNRSKAEGRGSGNIFDFQDIVSQKLEQFPLLKSPLKANKNLAKYKKSTKVLVCNGKKVPAWAEDQAYLEEQVRYQNEHCDAERDIFGQFTVDQIDLNQIFSCSRYADTRSSSPWLSGSEMYSTPQSKSLSHLKGKANRRSNTQTKKQPEQSHCQTQNNPVKNTPPRKSPFKRILESFQKAFFTEKK